MEDRRRAFDRQVSFPLLDTVSNEVLISKEGLSLARLEIRLMVVVCSTYTQYKSSIPWTR
jgi:hypothetical protein